MGHLKGIEREDDRESAREREREKRCLLTFSVGRELHGGEERNEVILKSGERERERRKRSLDVLIERLQSNGKTRTRV